MKKILSFVMALAMVTSLVATPKVALLNKSAKKTRTELTLPAVQKQQPQVKHVAKKNIVRKAVNAATEITPEQALEIGKALADNATTDVEYRVVGIVSYANNYSTQYGNQTFSMSSDGADSKSNFKAYQCYLDAPGVVVGDSVAVTGKILKYVSGSNTTIEIKQGTVEILGGDVPPTPPTPAGDVVTPEQALEIGKALADNATTDVEYRVVGIVSYANDYNTQYGSQTFSMSSDGADSKSNFKAYQCYLAAPGVVVGDSVAVTGKILKYVSGSNTTIEIKQGTVEILGGDVPPTPPTPTGDVEIKGLQYADAIFYADETYGDYWAFDFYKELDEEGYILSPYVYFVCEESTTSGTKIAGTWTAYDAGYFATDDEESGIYTDEENPVGSLTVTCVSQGVYNFVGSFVGEDGKTYTWTLNNMEVYAYNGDTYEDITLTDGGEPTPVGDTIPLTTIDGLEFGYYGSYSEEGAYNYTLTVYNSQSEEYVPQASFDIYTEQLNVFPGTYSAEAGNLGLDYSAYFPTADSEGEYLSAATIEITDGEDGMIHVTGVFITEAGQAYSIDLTAAPYVYDADYPYEPEDPIVLNLTAVSMEEDAEYGSEGMIYAYLYMEDESYVSLTYRALSAIQHLQDGTYPIADLEEESSYLTGYDFYGWPAGSYYEDVNGNVYYFVSGTVTVESLDGATTITINATSAHGSSITVTYSGETPQPSGDHTIVIADYADVSFTTLDGAYTVVSAQNGGASKPAYNAEGKDARLYANNTFTLTSNNGAMTEIVFNISDKGLTRQADIAVSAGEITSYDMTNAKVTWVGNATEVIFTVGDKNTHGTDAPSKAGQFDFTSIDIVTVATGLQDLRLNDNVKKFMYKGQVVIRKSGKNYNVLGAEL